MVYYLVKFISKLMCLVPQSIRKIFALVLGQIAWLAVPSWRRKMALANIQESLGMTAQEAAIVAKNSVLRFGEMFTEVLRFPQLRKDNLGELVEIEGGEYLDEALSYGKGVVMASVHSGNWELILPTLAALGYPVVAVGKKQRNKDMDRFIYEYRGITGAEVTYSSGVRDIIRLLEQKKIIGLLFDQDAHGTGTFVDFFGRPASTPPGPAVLARMKGAPIVPVFIEQQSNGKHLLRIFPIVWQEKTSDKDGDILCTMQLLTKMAEEHIKAHPHEWFWLHNRWKTKKKPSTNSVA